MIFFSQTGMFLEYFWRLKLVIFWTSFGAFWTSGGCTLRKVLILERLDLRWMHVIERFDLRWMHGRHFYNNFLLFLSSSAAAQPKIFASHRVIHFPQWIFLLIPFQKKDTGVWKFPQLSKIQTVQFGEHRFAYILRKKSLLTRHFWDFVLLKNTS